MRAVVDASQATRVDVAVDLCRRERCVAEEFLDDAQVGAALEEVRREGVPETMGVAQEPSHSARVEAAAPHRQEDRVVRSGRQCRATVRR